MARTACNLRIRLGMCRTLPECSITWRRKVAPASPSQAASCSSRTCSCGVLTGCGCGNAETVDAHSSSCRHDAVVGTDTDAS